MPTLVLPFPAINPILVQWGPLAIRWYALAYIAGLVLGWLLIRRIVSNDRYWSGREEAERREHRRPSRLLRLRRHHRRSAGQCALLRPASITFAHPLEIFKIWEGGMAFHGGLIGAFVGIVLFARRYRAPTLTVLDLCSLAAPIGLFFGRIANFITARALGPADQCSLGGGLPEDRRTAASPEPDLRSAARRTARLRHPFWRWRERRARAGPV